MHYADAAGAREGRTTMSEGIGNRLNVGRIFILAVLLTTLFFVFQQVMPAYIATRFSQPVSTALLVFVYVMWYIERKRQKKSERLDHSGLNGDVHHSGLNGDVPPEHGPNR